MAKKRSVWKKCSWRVEYAGYRLMELLLSLLPLALIDQMGRAMGTLLFYLSKRYRELAIRNLRIAYGAEKSLPEIRSLARATCQRTIANFLGAMKTALLPSEKASSHVSIEGNEPLAQALAEQKGAILVLGHMGNWEVLNRLHQYLPDGVTAGGVYQPLKNPLVDKHLLQQREQDGSKLFSKRRGFHGPVSFIKEGGLLIIVADQKVARSGTPLPFFNRISPLSPLPSLLARKTGAPIFAAGIATTRPGHWHISLEPISKPDTETIIRALEKQINNSPTDYLWLHNRWKLPRAHPLDLDVKKALPIPENTSPLQVLILSENSTDLTVAKAYQKNRPATSLPLQFHHLTCEDNCPPESLAAQIRTLDQALTYPLQLVILPSPSTNLEKAVALSGIPALRSNQNKLPLADFLESLSRTA